MIGLFLLIIIFIEIVILLIELIDYIKLIIKLRR